MNCMTIGILIGLGFSVFIAFILFLEGYEPQTCINTLVAAGITFCSLCGLLGYWCDADKKIDNTIKATINANYDNMVNYHNNIEQQSFVSDGSKYTFDYDDDTKTLTVFTDTSSNVDAVFINGVKQDNQKTSDKADKKKDCVSYKTDDTDKADTQTSANSNNNVYQKKDNADNSDLSQKIQGRIHNTYKNAVINSFDVISLSGTFICDNVQYNFSWENETLKVVNTNEPENTAYYKYKN